MEQYQRDAITLMKSALRTYSYTLLVMTMRARKTHTVLTTLAELDASKVLIVCPPQVIPVWEKHLTWEGMERVTDVEIVSTAMLRRRTTTAKYNYLVVDEVQDFRHNSIQSRNLRKISKGCKYKVGLTGTLFNKSLMELYVPLSILQPPNGEDTPLYNTKSKARWNIKWGVVEGYRSRFPSYKINPHLEQRFYQELKKFTYIKDPKIVRRPELIQVPYDLSKQQENICTALDERAIFQVAGHTVWPDNALSAAHINNKKRQVCSGFLYDEERTLIIPSAKWVTLVALIGRLRKGGEMPCIVWYNYQQELNYLCSVLAHLGSVCKFKRGKDFAAGGPDFILCHPRSAGAGVDLSFANTSIYVSITDDFVNYKQSEYRTADQLGTHKNNYVLVAKGSIETQKFRKLQEKDRAYSKVYEEGEQ